MILTMAMTINKNGLSHLFQCIQNFIILQIENYAIFLLACERFTSFFNLNKSPNWINRKEIKKWDIMLKNILKKAY